MKTTTAKKRTTTRTATARKSTKRTTIKALGAPRTTANRPIAKILDTKYRPTDFLTTYEFNNLISNLFGKDTFVAFVKDLCNTKAGADKVRVWFTERINGVSPTRFYKEMAAMGFKL